VALNLARPDDLELIPALTARTSSQPWTAVAEVAKAWSAEAFVERSRLLGLAAAAVTDPGGHAPADSAVVTQRCASKAGLATGPWTVVDLSSLWAGPVVARILSAAGAAVIKVESSSRPDGARAAPAFYAWLHAQDELVVSVDLDSRSGRQRVADLIGEADVVIEGSRPRALEHLGLGPDCQSGRPGQVWLSITGHGRDAPGRDWVAFGDDAAVAGGLVGWDRNRQPVFCGDAIADPLTGLVGALLVLRAQDAGGGQLIDLAMSRVAAAMRGRAEVAWHDLEVPVIVERGGEAWQVRAGAEVELVRDWPPTLQWIET
jgi:hypothetical protein